MPDAKTYKGGCHCRRVQYEAASDLSQVISCNCSICTNRGLLLTFVKPAQFSLLSGQNDLGDYQFNKKKIHQLFCRACGVESFARGSNPDGSEMIAINVRFLDGVDLGALKPMPFDGRSR